MTESSHFRSLQPHHCRYTDDCMDSMYGAAIYDCKEQPDGSLWIDNGEYASAVRFCPYCGFQGKWLGLNAKLMGYDDG